MSHQLGGVNLPTPPGQPGGLLSWASVMVQALTNLLSGIVHHSNEQPRAPEFTVATRPAAADWKGRIIFVSDGGAGAVFQGSDGSNWVNLG